MSFLATSSYSALVEEELILVATSYASQNGPYNTELITLPISNSHNRTGETSVSSYAKGITLGGIGTTNIDGNFGSNMFFGVGKNTTEGSPATPCLELKYANKWRFKWSLAIGTRTISVKCKQVSNLSPRPSLTVKSNASVGLSADLITYAPSGTDWVTIGPASFVSTGTDAVWVELANNMTSSVSISPTLFDHIVVT
jgi:hypothetical protein